MAEKTANEQAGRVLASYDHMIGDYPKGETEPTPIVKPAKGVPKSRRRKTPRLEQHNEEEV